MSRRGHFRISSGGKVRVRVGRVSVSNRGGARVRLGGGISVGKTGPRYSGGAGPFRYSAGATGVRGAIVGGKGPFYGGVNASGPFVGAGFGGVTLGKSGRASKRWLKANPQRWPYRDDVHEVPKSYLNERAFTVPDTSPRALSRLEWQLLCGWDRCVDIPKRLVLALLVLIWS